jgi:hypothetical protein
LARDTKATSYREQDQPGELNQVTTQAAFNFSVDILPLFPPTFFRF